MLFHEVDHVTNPCYGSIHASGKHENLEDLVTDPNHWLWNRWL